jgi:hypothetical protein
LQIGRGVLCALCGLLLVLGAERRRAGAEIIDRVLAVVAGNLITLSDVNAVIDLHLMIIDEGADPIRQILPRLVDRALMLAEVERYAPPEPDADAVNRQLGAVRARFPTAQAFETTLARVGFDERHLRETLRQDLRIVAYLDQRFTVQPPTDDDLGRYYRAHPQRFTENERLTPFNQARPRVLEAATTERRQRLVDDWVNGLRRRAEIIDLSATAR